VHVTIYLWLSVRLLNQHELRIKATFSYVERINPHWLRHLIIGVLVVLIYTMSYLGL
jgi:hypothetical protein